MVLEQKYKKLDHREHVLTRPGMYIGSIEPDTYNTWVYDEEKNQCIKKEIKSVPGLYKIFDEVLVNAIDHVTRMKQLIIDRPDEDHHPVKNIKITIDKTCGLISVFNDGDGIEVEKHKEHNVYIPELIFGNMLTSTNYDDNAERIIGGTNGVGSKCLALDTPIPLFDGSFKLAKDVKPGDILIGDDGKKRTVLSTNTGHGKMYEVSQVFGESYKVNDQHILTLHMPDHKVIFWNTNGWSMLWWDRQEKRIRTKFMKAFDNPKQCPECEMSLNNSNMRRHYSRQHPGVAVPSKARKLPTKTPDMSDIRVKNAYIDMTMFANTIDDDNVIDISIQDYIKLSSTTQSRLSGVRGNCVDWPYKPVELDPYVLGLWLGDGMKHGFKYACFGEKDPEIIDYLKEWGESNDANIVLEDKYNYRFVSKSHPGRKGHSPLRKQLRKYNLINNKHIPQDYIINSRDVRLKLLAGFIDTDGSVCRDGSRVTISQGLNHEELIRSLLYVARSLGFCCTLNKYKSTYTHKNEKRVKDAFKLNISGNIQEIPTRLPRKKCNTTKSINTDKTTGHITVKEIGNDDYIGFQIDGNERFVINDFTVTHNCTNIFSKSFTVETVDHRRKRIYTQQFQNNMSEKTEPSIKSCTKKPYTMITFLPDYNRFGLNGLTDDMHSLFLRRCYDVCALTDTDVNVWINGKKIEFKNFEKYADLFLGDKATKPRVYERISDRWEITASYVDVPGFEQVSFVNGVWTINGGKHVDYISNQITTKLIDIITKKKKGLDIKPQHVKNYLMLFVKSTIVNPTFDSQSKECLTTPSSKFGSKPEVSDKFIEKLAKTDLVDKIMSLCDANANKNLKKTDGQKKRSIKGMPKLEDANWAGTSRSKECVLILTEGDSAMSMAISGLSEVGRDRYGVFPLKGKIMNVKDQALKKIAENDEITNLKKILGLESGKTYNSPDDLRYGRIMLMTDQDMDGFHIRGLLFNMFHSMWPSLVKCNAFLTSMLTPIIKASKGQQVLPFYTLQAYEEWAKTNDLRGWTIKYFKGLGTSTAEEAKQYFRDLKVVNYKYTPKVSDEKLDLAFNKKKADERKDWLGQYNRSSILDLANSEVTFEDFVDKELIHFSNYDVERSIPNVCDGLKTSQRKILYACFKKGLTKEIKVAQLSGYVSENAAYHHGDASLQGAITNMAQNFVGSNNINLLQPNGQFGTRRLGGKDAASPRYIFTHLTPLTQCIFPKLDNDILTYLEDDGYPVEPEYYIPIIPMVLVNGAIGIGTGFSTNIPCYNPLTIVDILERLLKGEVIDTDLTDMVPWYAGFKGMIEKTGPGKFVSRGLFTRTATNKVNITELPLGFWTQDFKEHLEEVIDKCQDIKEYSSHYTETDILFTITFTSADACEKYLQVEANGYTKLENDMKLVSSKNLSTSNMYLFNSKCQIKKYETPFDIIRDFFDVRLLYYQLRKEKILKKLTDDIELLKNKIRFIKEVVSERLAVHKLKKAALEEYLSKNKYMKHDESFDYILRIPVYNLTIDKVEELENEMSAADKEIKRVTSLDVKTWWQEDLDNFKQEYAKFASKTNNNNNKDSSKTAVKTLGKRKAVTKL